MDKETIFNFEKRTVWQKAMDLSIGIYKITEKFLPTEQFFLTDQIRHAVSANIAEDYSRKTVKDKAHFTTIAFNSLMETMNHLILSSKLNYPNNNILYEFPILIKK